MPATMSTSLDNSPPPTGNVVFIVTSAPQVMPATRAPTVMRFSALLLSRDRACVTWGEPGVDDGQFDLFEIGCVRGFHHNAHLVGGQVHRNAVDTS